MAKVSAKKIYKEIEFNERRLLLLLSNDLLWFKKNLVNIKSHKNRKAFYKKKTEKYNQIFTTTQELSKLSNALTKTDGDFTTSPYVYLEQERLANHNVKIKNNVKVKNLSKPKLFEVVSFTHFVDLFNNPKSRKFPKNKCIQIVKNKILDKNNNMPSSVMAREYYLKNIEEGNLVINNLYIDSALYLKKDMELEMQANQHKTRKKQQEKALENHAVLTKQASKQKVKESKTLTKQKKDNKQKVSYDAHTKTFVHNRDDENELNF